MPSGVLVFLGFGGTVRAKTKSSGRSPAKSFRCKGQERDEGAIEMDYDPLSPTKLFEKDSYTLPYSEHACFSELEDFVQTVRPSTVIGIVSTSFCYVNPRHHFSLCGDNVYFDKTPVKNKTGHAGNLTKTKWFKDSERKEGQDFRFESVQKQSCNEKEGVLRPKD